MSKKEAYEKQLEGQLNEWKATIDKYKAEAQQISGESQAKYYEQIEALEARRKAAQHKLNEFKDKSGDAWEDMKAGMDSAWHSLGNAVRSASSRFKDAA